LEIYEGIPIFSSLFETDTNKNLILHELQQADFDIFDIYYEDSELHNPYFVNKNGIITDFESLSQGTKKYLCMIVSVLLKVFKNGSLYVVDDLDASLHPLLVRRFIEMFKSKQLNPKNARLLFSTNDVMSLHQSSLNGDQIWFMDRDKDSQETKLYSPADYSDFEPLNLQRDYILGCYDATPNTSWRGNCWIGGVEC
jgi:AAA15 family ATPase/GTPase